jgi:hypothetical protein
LASLKSPLTASKTSDFQTIEPASTNAMQSVIENHNFKQPQKTHLSVQKMRTYNNSKLNKIYVPNKPKNKDATTPKQVHRIKEEKSFDNIEIS